MAFELNEFGDVIVPENLLDYGTEFTVAELASGIGLVHVVMESRFGGTFNWGTHMRHSPGQGDWREQPYQGAKGDRYMAALRRYELATRNPERWAAQLAIAHGINESMNTAKRQEAAKAAAVQEAAQQATMSPRRQQERSEEGPPEVAAPEELPPPWRWQLVNETTQEVYEWVA